MRRPALLFMCLTALLSGGAMCEPKETSLCPNETCDHGSGETLRNCPQDCSELCGNRRCDLGIENADSCPQDCGCGDGRCKDTETPNTCQADCRVGCGDQICAPWDGESITSCPLDCSGACGDGRCDWQRGESFEDDVCPGDCSGCESGDLECAAFGPCGDGRCECAIGENRFRCAQDCDGTEACSSPPDRCGNEACEATFDESPATCPSDCRCGDGACDQLSESGRDCPQDCTCGDGVCATAMPYRETRINCPADCTCEDGVCAGADVSECEADCYCGDTVCDRTERHSACASDCFCGDGKCHVDETHDSCPRDCEAPPDAGAAPEITSIDAPTSPTSAETGQFSASVSGAATTYAWDFGGGATPDTSSATSPSVTFGAPGSYSVRLVASNAYGSSPPYALAYVVESAQLDAGPDDAGSCGELDEPCCIAPAPQCADGLACEGSVAPVCVSTGPGAGSIDFVSCACVGAPLGVFASLCTEVPACVQDQPAPEGTCDSVCTSGTASSACSPSSLLCN